MDYIINLLKENIELIVLTLVMFAFLIEKDFRNKRKLGKVLKKLEPTGLERGKITLYECILPFAALSTPLLAQLRNPHGSFSYGYFFYLSFFLGLWGVFVSQRNIMTVHEKGVRIGTRMYMFDKMQSLAYTDDSIRIIMYTSSLKMKKPKTFAVINGEELRHVTFENVTIGRLENVY